MTSRLRTECAWLALGTGLWCMSSIQAASTITGTGARRLDAIHRAQVWSPVNVSAMDFKAGPPGSLAFNADETVSCNYVERTRGSGSTPKFNCALPSGGDLKVRYGNRNGEVYAQVAATRLLWALGFGANRMYPVKVQCHGCSWDPFQNPKEAARPAVMLFDPATIDVKAQGFTLETKPDEGWSWKELDQVDERAGGAPVAHRDALKLLAVLIQHSSSKAINQRILCLDGPSCAHPLMMITDVGKTFGGSSALNNDDIAAVNFKEWSQTPIWKGSTTGCVGNLSGSWSGTLKSPRIGEAGRTLLANQLSRLTDAQLHDLFDVARFPQRDHTATVEDWVNAFKQKRAEIASRTCAA
jgi:hypothetical protein